MSIKKETYLFTIELDDYGDDVYNSNIVMPVEYNNSGYYEKLTMLYSILDLIKSEVDDLETKQSF